MFSKSSTICGCPIIASKLARKIVIVEFPKRAVDRNAGGPLYNLRLCHLVLPPADRQLLGPLLAAAAAPRRLVRGRGRGGGAGAGL